MASGKRPQPGKNPTIRTQRRKTIAKALVEQVPTTQIAQAIGISRQMVNHEIRQEETQGFIKSAMQPYLDDIREMIPSALGAVREGLGRARPYEVEQEDGTTKVVAIPNDQVDRLRASKLLMNWLELAEGKKDDGALKHNAQRFSGTMHELLVLYRETVIEETSDSHSY